MLRIKSLEREEVNIFTLDDADRRTRHEHRHQERHNLGRKLAIIVQGKASSMILGIYEQERIACARRLITTTDKAFQTIPKLTGTLLREYAAPYVLLPVFKFSFPSKNAFKILFQIHINKFTWKVRMKDAGFKQDALYLTRPDGHVVLATDKQLLRVLTMYLEAVGDCGF